MTTTTLAIPPLSQSRQALMACPHLYVETHVHGIQRPSNEYAERGAALHLILARYVHHLVEARVPSAPEMLDAIAAGVDLDNEGRDIIDHLRQSFYLDPEKVAHVELHLALDKNLKPLVEMDEPEAMPEEAAEYEGTLDLVLMHSPTEAEIPDWKSYYQVIDADTFQSKLYPLLLFKHNPKLEKVTFRLEFIRWGVGRSVVWTRADVAKLETIVKAERARQVGFHDVERPPSHLAALPGKHCAWCPKLRSCPLGESNPMTRSVDERIRFAIWLDNARTENLDALKAHVNVQGPIRVQDGNGQTYEAGFALKEKSEYLLLPTMEVITEYVKTTGEDITGKLKIGATDLNSLAKAKKRADLRTALDTVKSTNGYTEFGVGKVAAE